MNSPARGKSGMKYAEVPVYSYQTYDPATLSFRSHPIVPRGKILFSEHRLPDGQIKSGHATPSAPNSIRSPSPALEDNPWLPPAAPTAPPTEDPEQEAPVAKDDSTYDEPDVIPEAEAAPATPDAPLPNIQHVDPTESRLEATSSTEEQPPHADEPHSRVTSSVTAKRKSKKNAKGKPGSSKRRPQPAAPSKQSADMIPSLPEQKYDAPAESPASPEQIQAAEASHPVETKLPKEEELVVTDVANTEEPHLSLEQNAEAEAHMGSHEPVAADAVASTIKDDSSNPEAVQHAAADTEKIAENLSPEIAEPSEPAAETEENRDLLDEKEMAQESETVQEQQDEPQVVLVDATQPTPEIIHEDVSTQERKVDEVEIATEEVPQEHLQSTEAQESEAVGEAEIPKEASANDSKTAEQEPPEVLVEHEVNTHPSEGPAVGSTESVGEPVTEVTNIHAEEADAAVEDEPLVAESEAPETLENTEDVVVELESLAEDVALESTPESIGAEATASSLSEPAAETTEAAPDEIPAETVHADKSVEHTSADPVESDTVGAIVSEPVNVEISSAPEPVSEDAGDLIPAEPEEGALSANEPAPAEPIEAEPAPEAVVEEPQPTTDVVAEESMTTGDTAAIVETVTAEEPDPEPETTEENTVSEGNTSGEVTALESAMDATADPVSEDAALLEHHDEHVIRTEDVPKEISAEPQSMTEEAPDEPEASKDATDQAGPVPAADDVAGVAEEVTIDGLAAAEGSHEEGSALEEHEKKIAPEVEAAAIIASVTATTAAVAEEKRRRRRREQGPPSSDSPNTQRGHLLRHKGEAKPLSSAMAMSIEQARIEREIRHNTPEYQEKKRRRQERRERDEEQEQEARRNAREEHRREEKEKQKFQVEEVRAKKRKEEERNHEAQKKIEAEEREKQWKAEIIAEAAEGSGRRRVRRRRESRPESANGSAHGSSSGKTPTRPVFPKGESYVGGGPLLMLNVNKRHEARRVEHVEHKEDERSRHRHQHRHEHPHSSEYEASRPPSPRRHRQSQKGSRKNDDDVLPITRLVRKFGLAT